ncbi:MAG: efflux RND transporter periplasmic adaptor subunit [Proteobacteria bacterium]|nr:efflux RND transporter periplasmic adaptor subunit [Pseudomonadota bacterium]
MSSSIVRRGALVAAAVALVTVGAAGGFWLSQHDSPAKPTRAVLYWYDPMQPSQHFNQPGKSPFMDMQLIPKYADEGAQNGIRVDPAMTQLLGIRYTTVQRGKLSQPVAAVGSISFNERDIAVVQTRSAGFVTRVYARAPGDVIERNAPLVDLLAPEWTGAQTEFLALLRSADPALIEAARERMTLVGMPPELIAQVERSGQPQATVTVRSPIAGVIAALDAREGMSMPSGATIASINGLGSVWLDAAIPEARGVEMATGRDVTVRLPAYPGESFKGRLITILPQANAQTRTLRARIELPNPGARLRPGMFANVSLGAEDSEAVSYVATEALIRTGQRTVAIVAGENGHFIPTAVETGRDVGVNTVILRGLTQGQRVVASGQFLIDSEASLKEVLARLDGGRDRAGAAQ